MKELPIRWRDKGQEAEIDCDKHGGTMDVHMCCPGCPYWRRYKRRGMVVDHLVDVDGALAIYVRCAYDEHKPKCPTCGQETEEAEYWPQS